MTALCFLRLWVKVTIVNFPCGLVNVFKKIIGSSHFHEECYAPLSNSAWRAWCQKFLKERECKGKGKELEFRESERCQKLPSNRQNCLIWAEVIAVSLSSPRLFLKAAATDTPRGHPKYSALGNAYQKHVAFLLHSKSWEKHGIFDSLDFFPHVIMTFSEEDHRWISQSKTCLLKVDIGADI